MYTYIHCNVYMYTVMYQYTLHNYVYTNINVKIGWRTQT